MNLATLFVDESGKSSLAQKENEPFILTGVILDDKDKQIIEGFFGYIKLKYGINPDKPFHSYDIFENPTSKLSDNSLVSLSENLGEFISLIPIRAHIFAINKNIFKTSLGIRNINDFKGSSERKEMKEYPYRIMSTKLFSEFGKYLEHQDQIGQVIADSRRGADYQMIRTLSTIKENGVPIDADAQKSIKNRLNAISFAEKGYLSGGLEITDLISYTSFIRARKQITAFSNTGIVKIWNQIKKKTELKEIKEKEIRKFFDVKKGGIHKHLK